jgi:GNAT superfamily N-acetyltransferase
MKIYQANIKDVEAISTLISSVAHYFTLHPQGEGAESFLKTIQPSSIADYIKSDQFSYFTAFIGNDLAGVVAIRDNEHLFHLFVAPQFQRQGIAKKLWLFAKDVAITAANTVGFTVNSTEFAIPVYEKFGFKVAGQRVETEGIAFVPMKLNMNMKNS